jgi:hypothetical protein
MNVGVQLYINSTNPDGWPMISATENASGGAPKIFPLYRGLDNTIEFTENVPVGTYTGNFRILLFAAQNGGIDFGHQVYDSSQDPHHPTAHLAFKVLTTQGRITGPQLVYSEFPNSVPDNQGTYTVTIPAKVKFPTNYTDQSALWGMAKGDGGFAQTWIPLADAKPSDDPLDHYMQVPLSFVMKGVKPGLWNVNFGLFTADWKSQIQWIYPGLDFEVGGDAWETKATSMPPRLKVVDRKFVKVDDNSPVALYDSDKALTSVGFVRGGNYGNALDWDLHPALDTPGYFVLLGDIGCRFVRMLFDPDRYLNQDMYQHAVDQVVQNIWQAGEYPLIAGQDLPKGDTLQARIDGGLAVCRLLALKYTGKPVWIELANEPHEFDTWKDWKPVAEKYIKTIRGIDSDAFIVVPFESWQKDGRGAAADPITDTHVDLYDGHAYIYPKDVEVRYGSATKAGLPVIIGEYGGNAAYLTQMNEAFQALSPSPLAIAPWAFTIKGQDALPLVANAEGADIQFTPAGQAVVHAYKLWMQGKKLE